MMTSLTIDRDAYQRRIGSDAARRGSNDTNTQSSRSSSGGLAQDALQVSNSSRSGRPALFNQALLHERTASLTRFEHVFRDMPFRGAKVFIPNDCGIAPVPEVIRMANHPKRLAIHLKASASGTISVLRGVWRTGDILLLPLVAGVAHAFTLAQRVESEFRLSEIKPVWFTTAAAIAARDYISGANAVFAHHTGRAYADALTQPWSEVGRVRTDLSCRYGVKWLQTIETWSRDPASMSLRDALGWALAVRSALRRPGVCPAVEDDALHVGQFLAQRRVACTSGDVQAICALAALEHGENSAALTLLDELWQKELDPLKMPVAL